MGLVRELLIRLGVKTNGAEKKVKDLSVSFTELNQSVELAQKAFRLLTGASDTVFKTLDQGKTVINVTRGFEALTEEANLLASTALRDLRTATKGTIDDFALMQQAAQGIQLGLPADQMDEMAGVALKLGAAVGRDATDAFSDLITGVGRASPLILDNLGITLKAEEAYRIYAKTLNTTADQLTATQKAEAFRAAAIEKAIEKASRLPEVELNAAQAADKLAASIKNQTNEFAASFAENDRLADVLEELSDVVSRIDVETLANDIAEMAAGFFDAAGAVAEFVQELEILPSRGNTVRPLLDSIKSIGSSLPEVEQLSRQIDTINKRLAHNRKETELDVKAQQGLQNALKELERAAESGGNKFLEMVKSEILLSKQNDVLKNKFQDVTEEIQRNGKENAALERLLARLENRLKRVQKETGETGDETKKFTKEIAKLQEEYEKLERSIRIDSLKEALEDAAKATNSADFASLKAQLEAEVSAGVLAGLGEAANSPEAQRIAAEIAKLETDEFAKATLDTSAEALKDAHAESVDFYKDLMQDVIEGDLGDFFENMLKRAAVEFGANILANLTGGFNGSNVTGLVNSVLGGGGAGGVSIGGGGVSLSGLLGPLFGESTTGGPTGAEFGGGLLASIGPAIAASIIAGPTISGFEKLFSGDKMNLGEELALALPTFGLSLVADQFGSGKNETEKTRDAFKDALKDVLGPDLQFDLIGGKSTSIGNLDFGANLDTSNPQLAQAIALTKGISLSLAGGGELGTGVNSVFAQAIADAANMTEVLINSQLALDQLGLTADGAKMSLIDAFLEGELALDQLNDGLNSLNLVGTSSIESVRDAMLAAAKSFDDSPRTALKALELAFTKLEEQGIDTGTEIRDYFVDIFGPDVADAIFELTDNGIENFEDFTNLSAEQLQELFNEVKAVATSLGHEIEISVTSATSGMATATEDAADAMTRSLESVRRVTRQLRGDFNDARAEAIRLQGALGSVSSGAKSATQDVNETIGLKGFV